MIRYAVRNNMQSNLAHPYTVEPVCGTEIPGGTGTTFVHTKLLTEFIIGLTMSESFSAVKIWARNNFWGLCPPASSPGA